MEIIRQLYSARKVRRDGGSASLTQNSRAIKIPFFFKHARIDEKCSATDREK